MCEQGGKYERERSEKAAKEDPSSRFLILRDHSVGDGGCAVVGVNDAPYDDEDDAAHDETHETKHKLIGGSASEARKHAMRRGNKKEMECTAKRKPTKTVNREQQGKKSSVGSPDKGSQLLAGALQIRIDLLHLILRTRELLRLSLQLGCSVRTNLKERGREEAPVRTHAQGKRIHRHRTPFVSSICCSVRSSAL